MSVTSAEQPHLGEKRGRSRRRFAAAEGRGRFGWWPLMLPAAVVVAVFFAWPVLRILSQAFTFHGGADKSALSNLDWFFSDPVQTKILVRTFVTAAVVTVICLVVCYPFAYLISIVGGRWRMVLFAVAIVSCWQSVLVRNYGWRIVLRDTGVLNDITAALGLGRFELLGTTAGVMIGMTQIMAPFMILALYASMRNIDRRLLAAAHSLGASPASAFARIYVPLTAPGILAGCLLVSILSLGFYITPALLGSNANALLSQAIVLQIQRTLDWGHAGAQALVLVSVTVALVAVGALIARRRLVVWTGRTSGARG